MTKRTKNDDFAKKNVTKNGVNSENNKAPKKSKDTTWNAVCYGTTAAIFILLFILALEFGLYDNKFENPENRCPSTDKLIFNQEKGCYDTITLDEAKRRLGSKTAEALPNMYNIKVEYNADSHEYSKKCYLAIEKQKLCDTEENSEQINNLQNNSGAWLKNKHTKLTALYNNAMKNKEIYNK